MDKENQGMAHDMQEPIDVRTINWQEDVASTKGTQALRYLVHTLHEAQMNLSLQPMVRALMRSNNLLAPSNEEGPNPTHNSSPKSTEAQRDSDRDELSLRLPLEDVASLTLLIALQRGQESQVIALRRTLEMAKAREEDISKREEGLHLHQVCHPLMMMKNQMHLPSLLQKCI